MKRRGYTKEVLLAQIQKYKNVLSWSDGKIIHWANRIVRGFGSVSGCPVCGYRWDRGIRCHVNGVKPCLALVDNSKCTYQDWYKTVKTGTLYRIKEVRKALKYRLKFWQKIYAEKYPVKS